MSKRRTLQLWERLVLTTPHLCKIWGVTGPGYDDISENPWDDDTIIGAGPIAAFEHLLHEMAHAEDLGIRIGPRLSGKVAAECARDLGLNPEAHTWAIEWFVWKRLRLPFEWSDIEEAARMQNVADGRVDALVSGTLRKKDCPGDYDDGERIPSPFQFRVKARKIVERLKSEEAIWRNSGRPHNFFHRYRFDLLTEPDEEKTGTDG